MPSTYDVLGDPNEYEEWLTSQQPPEPVIKNKRADVAQQIQELPEDIRQVAAQLDQQHASVILSAYQQLQLSRYAWHQVLAHHLKNPVEAEFSSVTCRIDARALDSIVEESGSNSVSLDRSAEVSAGTQTSSDTQMQKYSVAKCCFMPEYGC